MALVQKNQHEVPGTPALPRATASAGPVSRAVALLLLLAAACGETAAPSADAALDSATIKKPVTSVISPDTAQRTLKFAAGDTTYRVDVTPGAHGAINGAVSFDGVMPLDTMVVPDRDSTGCKAFRDVTLPLARAARGSKPDSTQHDVGNAVVWLMGVTHGPRDTLSRRVNLALDDCQLTPRVSVAPAGATINISNRNDMMVKLEFADHGYADTPRATIGFTDAGQVVPSVLPLANPGLVQVVDDKHPWVKAFIAVAPHPFVAVTDASGKFVFEGVPVGEYQMVVWHERFGARVLPVRVESGARAEIAVRY